LEQGRRLAKAGPGSSKLAARIKTNGIVWYFFPELNNSQCKEISACICIGSRNKKFVSMASGSAYRSKLENELVTLG